MCGIIGYIGRKPAQSVLLDGLRRLEYRGYDSAGICVLNNGKFELRRKAGRIQELSALLRDLPAPGNSGIGHTRWATHGPPTDENAHPHLDQSGKIALVHNGVIENHQQIKERLLSKGHSFQSQTDTEVLAHLVGEFYQPARGGSGAENGSALADAVRKALKEVVGTYGIAVVHAEHPDVIVGARRGSPLLVGVGHDENFLASDVSPIIAYTRRVVYLNDFEIVTLTRDDFQVSTIEAAEVSPKIHEVEFGAEDVERGKFPHYMIKEISEQPHSVQDAFRGRVQHNEATARLGGLNLTPAELRAVDRILFIACGTAFHAALVGEYLMEDLARIPAECEYASEFRYRNAPIDKHTLVF